MVCDTSMQHHLEHQSPQFAVNSQFESFLDLKHACTRAALLDVYEFVPDKDLDRYILKCKDKECVWYLYASTFPGTDVWRIRKSTQAHSCHGIQHSGHRNVDEEFISTEILPKLRSDPNLLFRIISKSSTASSPTPKPGGHGNVLSKSSTVHMKKLTTLSPSTVKKFNVQTQGVLCNSISTQRRIDLNVCSFALRPVQWALLIVALCLVLMERI